MNFPAAQPDNKVSKRDKRSKRNITSEPCRPETRAKKQDNCLVRQNIIDQTVSTKVLFALTRRVTLTTESV